MAHVTLGRLNHASRRPLRRRVLTALCNRLGAEPLPLRIVFRDGETFDFAPAPQVTIALRSPRLLRLLASGNMNRLAQAYVEGELVADGRLQDVVRVGIALAERAGRVPLLRRAASLRARLPRRRSTACDAANIRYHYDVSNDFYRLWLGRHMVYSCAYFATGSEDLDTAQEQKLDHLCRKLRLKPGERLIDIGCGWGGLLCWAGSRYGVEAVGVTLSERQVEEAEARIAAAGLAGRAQVRLQHWRDIPEAGEFDKVVSVGMYEHVGLANLPDYFTAVARWLKPGGTALNHGITTTDRDSRPRGPAGGEFIDRFVFPGGELPHVSRVLYDVAGAGLELLDVEDLRPHYPPTLLHWVRRLEANREAAIAAVGEGRYRIWRLYMAGMAYAFDHGWLAVAQVLAQKPADGPAPRPWTRAYQYAADGNPPLSTGLDWGEL